MKVLYVMHNDFRIQDNAILNDIAKMNNIELSIITLLPANFSELSQIRKNNILMLLKDTNKSLQRFNQELLVYTNEEQVLNQLVSFNKLYLPLVFNSRDERQYKAILNTFKDKEVLRPNQSALIEKVSSKILGKSFTHFYYKVQDTPIDLTKREFSALPNKYALKGSITLDKEITNFGLIKPGEAQALKRLRDYIWNKKSITHYKETRNGMVNYDDSSKMSLYLAQGSLSVNGLMREIINFENSNGSNKSTKALKYELYWREYFKHYCKLHGDRVFAIGGPKAKKLEFDTQLISKWIDGETENDFINANMNELALTGWMSNRGRQNVANYLAKIMKQDWSAGSSYFEEQLIDYDTENNWGNWCYQAGVGSDGKDRVFDPIQQASFYDPEKVYRNKFLTKLKENE